MKHLHFFAAIALFAALGVGLVIYNMQPAAQYEGFNPSGGGTYTLKGSVGSTNTSIPLSSFTEPVSEIPYTMAYLNSDIEYGTLEPQTNRAEFISFTGITQNADGTATLTGVTRGLGRSYPYTASTTLARPHSGQTQFILSNTPQFYNEYASKRNNQWITGIWGFDINAQSSTTCATGFDYCNKNYIDAGLNQGAATSTFTNMGIVQLATRTQVAAGQASSTASGTVGAPLVIPSIFASSTPRAGLSSNIVPVTDLNGFISSLFIATTSNYTWTGLHRFTAATSTSFGIGGYLNWNGLGFTIGAGRAASSTVLMEDGTGNLTFNIPRVTTLSVAAGTISTNSSAATTSLKTVVLPANTFANNTSLKVTSMWRIGPVGSSDCSYELLIGTGAATTSIGNLFSDGEMDATIAATSTTGMYATSVSYGTASPISVQANAKVAPYSTTGVLYLSFSARAQNNSTCNLVNQTVTQLLSNP